jgi:hypothetical protein
MKEKKMEMNKRRRGKKKQKKRKKKGRKGSERGVCAHKAKFCLSTFSVSLFR